MHGKVVLQMQEWRREHQVKKCLSALSRMALQMPNGSQGPCTTQYPSFYLLGSQHVLQNRNRKILVIRLRKPTHSQVWCPCERNQPAHVWPVNLVSVRYILLVRVDDLLQLVPVLKIIELHSIPIFSRSYPWIRKDHYSRNIPIWDSRTRVPIHLWLLVSAFRSCWSGLC